MTRESLYYDDVAAGNVYTFGPYHVTREEMLAFNQRWDPLPMHVDATEAQARGYRDMTASGQYTLCVKQALLNEAPWHDAVIGALAHDDVKFPLAVYPDDQLSLTIECLETRPSRSNSERGIIKFAFRLFNQDEDTVLSYVHTSLFARRGTAS